MNSYELQLMDAVHNDDIKTVKELIGKGININFILDHCTPLHAALKRRSMDMFELLLSQPNIDLNISNEQLPAPLLWSLKYIYLLSLEGFILRLIQAGCNINMSNCYEETPLLLSLIHYSSTTIIHKLLKRGADINAQCSKYGTALHRAVGWGNLEVVCMLLYYNAELYIKWKGHTPFSYALYLERFEIVEVLNNYYSSLNDDVNYIIEVSNNCCAFLMYTNAELFKAVWPRFDPELVSMNNKFMYYYLEICRYSTSDWVESLYLILNSDIAFDLIEHYNRSNIAFDLFEYYKRSNSTSFLYELQKCMHKRGVPSEDRIGLIYMVLRLGFELEISNINYAVVLHGLNQDLEPFIYGTYRSIIDDGSYRSYFACPIHAFIIGMKTDYSFKKTNRLFRHSNEWHHHLLETEGCYEDVIAETFAKTVAFFSMPADVKNKIMRDRRNYIAIVGEQVQKIPEFPSLTELSRNQMHKYIVQKFRFKQPYQLQDFVKKLVIPNRIKDILLFKAPIY